MPTIAPRKYETVFLVPPTLVEADVEKVIDEIKETFASRGATVSLIERWGRRKTAYPVGKHREAWYVMLHVEGDGAAVQEVERRMRISENVLRYLSVRLDDVAGAEESGKQRQIKKARQEEERAQRAAERAAQSRDEVERPAGRDFDDRDGDDSSEDMD